MQNRVKRRMSDHDYLISLDEDSSSSTSTTFSSTSSSVMDPKLVLSSSADGSAIKKKRQRLTHLTPEEKLQRRKLKNRVAAQSARDRKKARMEELEITIKQLQKENQKLTRQNIDLKNTTRQLLEQNRKLLEAKKNAWTVPTKPLALMTNEVDGSAASALSVSLPWTQLRSTSASCNSRAQPSLLSKLQLFLALLLVLSSPSSHRSSSSTSQQQQRRRALLLNVLSKLQQLRAQRRRLFSSITSSSRALKRHGCVRLTITNFPT